MRAESIALLSTLLVVAAGAAAAQPPSVEVRLEPLPAGTNLDGALARAAASRDVLWLGWSVAAVPGHGDVCCFHGHGGNWSRRGCHLEGKGGGTSIFNGSSGEAVGSREIAVLARFVDGKVDELHPVGLDCQVHFGGRRLWWLGPVAPAESAARLATWATARDHHLDESTALLTLSLQQQGVDQLVRLARDRSLGRDLRREAVFWLGQSEDERAMEFLEKTLLRPASR